MARSVFIPLLVVLFAFPAAAAPTVLTIGRMDGLACQSALVSYARSAIERMHPGAVDEAFLGFPEDWVDVLLAADSNREHSVASAALLGKLVKLGRAGELPPLLTATMEWYQQARADDQIAFCAIPIFTGDRKTLGQTPAWCESLWTNEFLIDFEGEPIEGLGPGASDTLLWEIARKYGPYYILFTEGLLPKNDRHSGGDMLTHFARVVNQLQTAADMDLLRTWSRENLVRLESGETPDHIFRRYGGVENGRAVVKGGFLQVFLRSRAMFAGAQVVPSTIPGFPTRYAENAARAIEQIRAGGPAAQRVLDAEDIDETNVFSQGEIWGDTMRETIDDEH